MAEFGVSYLYLTLRILFPMFYYLNRRLYLISFTLSPFKEEILLIMNYQNFPSTKFQVAKALSYSSSAQQKKYYQVISLCIFLTKFYYTIQSNLIVIQFQTVPLNMIQSDTQIPLLFHWSLSPSQLYTKSDNKSERDQPFNSVSKKAHSNFRQKQISRIMEQIRLKYFLHQLQYRIASERSNLAQIVRIISKAQSYYRGALQSQHCVRFFVQQLQNLSNPMNLYVLRFLMKNVKAIKEMIANQQYVHGILNIASKLKQSSQYLAIIQQMLVVGLEQSHRRKCRVNYKNQINEIEDLCLHILQKQDNHHIITKVYKIVWLVSKSSKFSREFDKKFMKLRPQREMEIKFLMFYSLKKAKLKGSAQNVDLISLFVWSLNQKDKIEGKNDQLRAITIIVLRNLMKELQQVHINQQLFCLLVEYRNSNKAISTWYQDLMKKSLIATKQVGDQILFTPAIQFISYKISSGSVSEGYANIQFLKFFIPGNFDRTKPKNVGKMKGIIECLKHFMEKSSKYRLIGTKVQNIISSFNEL